MRRAMCVSLFVVAICAGDVTAGDWPQFRGPSGQGHAEVKTLPLQWSESDNIAWKVETPGEGWSSPVLVGGRLYLTGAAQGQDGGLSLLAFCMDAANGKVLWRTPVFEPEARSAPRIHDKNSHASPTPIVEGDRMYVHFGHLGTACLDLAGKVIWRNDTLRYQPVHGGGGSPIIIGGLLFFSCDGARDPFVVALDKRTGRPRWRTPRTEDGKKQFSFSTALAIEPGGKTQIISPGSDAVVAYDPADGGEIWKVRYPDGYSVVPRPVYGHGLVFLSSGFDRPVLYAIDPTGEGDVTKTHVKWTLARGAPHTPSPLLVGDELYVVSDGGVASCLDARSGEQHWQHRLPGRYSASPVYAAGRVYVQNETGVGVVFKAAKEYEELARSSVDGRTLASYAVDEGVIYLRSQTHLYCIKAQ